MARPRALSDRVVDEEEKLPAASADVHESFWRRPRAHRPHGKASAPTRTVRAARRPDRPALAEGMLKLMLILLAFFVFLHSRSEVSQERVTPILDSLALRFASSVETGSDAAARSAALEVDPGTLIRRRVVGHLPISAGLVEVPGALLAFDLDQTALFEPETAQVVRDRLVLLHRLAHALSEHEAGAGNVLVVTTAWPDAAPLLTAARLRALEAVFTDTPLAAARLGLGVADLPRGIWRFSIRAGHGHAA